MPSLVLDNLVKRLGDKVAVDGATLQIDGGELMVVLGPSGCGKTTTLRMICGLEQPDTGQITLAGRDITSLPPRQRNLGMVFQEYGLYPNMNVAGNIAYGLEARGQLSKQEIAARVRDAATTLGLVEHLNHPTTDLSGGEQQRVALARAMVKDADAYLFDEPLSNLDPKLRHRARRDITALHRSKGKPSVYVTHDQAEAFAMADRIAVMCAGRVEQVAQPTELVDRPASTFVAGFVGSPPMNLLTGHLSSTQGGLTVQVAGAALTLGDSWRPILSRFRGTDVTVGVPPDAIRLAPAPHDGELKATVETIESLIGETVVRMRTGDRHQITALLRGPEVDATTGDTLLLRVDQDRLRLFDPGTGRALSA